MRFKNSLHKQLSYQNKAKAYTNIVGTWIMYFYFVRTLVSMCFSQTRLVDQEMWVERIIVLLLRNASKTALQPNVLEQIK